MRLMRLISASERSSRIEGERQAWYLRLKEVWDEWKDGLRRLIRKIALKRALKRNSRKKISQRCESRA